MAINNDTQSTHNTVLPNDSIGLDNSNAVNNNPDSSIRLDNGKELNNGSIDTHNHSNKPPARIVVRQAPKGSQPSTQKTQQETDPEAKELQEIKDKFLRAPRFTRWRELYFDHDNSFKLNTFKNATLSAIIAYNLNPADPSDRKYASDLGYRNTKKCENWAKEYLEATGFTREHFLDILKLKVMRSDNARLSQMMGEILEVYNPKATTMVQNNIQNNTQVNVNDADQDDWDEKFKKFIDSQ